MAGSGARLIGLLALLALAPAPAVTQAPTVDVALVLAIDSSSSVNRDEFFLQTQGIAAAFADAEVQAAIDSGPHKAVAVTIMEWSHPTRQNQSMGWQIVTAASAGAYAEQIGNIPRYIEGGGTAIGSALLRAGVLVETAPVPAIRKVIDLSGDGKTSAGPPAAPIRDGLVARGITVNGLAVVNEEADVDDFFAANVIGGPGAFVEVAQDYDDFINAIKRKLLRELKHEPMVAAVTPARP